MKKSTLFTVLVTAIFFLGFHLTGWGQTSISTLAASSVSSTTATLNGIVISAPANTVVSFQYGTTTGYGTSVPAFESPLTGAAVNIHVSANIISGLVANTLYHFRIVVVNVDGTTNGNDLTFTTAPTTQASNITFSAVEGIGMTVNWSNGNGASRIVLINTQNVFTEPANGADPAPNTIYGGAGQQVVYNGTGNSVSVVGLAYGTIYWFKVYEFNGVLVSTSYCLLAGTNNPASQSTLTALCGIKTVGVGGNYATLTAAVADLNAKDLCGSLELMLIDPTYPSETFPIRINSNAGSSSTNTITIKPAIGISPVINCSTARSVILLAGADYVIIDGSNQVGGTSKNLTITNAYSVGAVSNVVAFDFGVLPATTRPATNSTVKNCILSGNGNTAVEFSSVVDLNVSTIGGNYANTTIQNNTLKNAKFGIHFTGDALSVTTNGIIRDNIIGDEFQPILEGGIHMADCNNTLITGNEIFGEIAGNANVEQFGIHVGPRTTNLKITNNKIHDFYFTGSAGVACWGILYEADALSSTEISNNLIYNIKSDGDQASQGVAAIKWVPSGIAIITGGNLQIYHNTINMSGNMLGTGPNSNSAGSSACLVVNNLITNLDVRNNIFKNSMTAITGTAGNRTYGIVSYAANTAFASLDYNDYFIDGLNPQIAYLATDIPTLAGWQTATAKEANSLALDPVFVSVTDFHPSQLPLNNKGIAIAGITTDIDGVTRLSPPDIGAYEFCTLPVAGAITGTGAVCAGTNGIIYSIVPLASATGYTWSVPTGATIVSGANTASITVNFALSAINGNITVYASNACGNGLTAPSFTVTVNPLPAAVDGTDRAICMNTSTTLGALAVAGNTYSWTSVPVGFTSAVAEPSVTPLETTTYTVVETISVTGCTNMNSVVVTVNPLPAAIAGSDRAICLNTSTTLGAIAVVGNTYSWTSVPVGFTSAVAEPSVTPLVTTTYSVVETISTGCTTMNSVVVTVNPLPAAIAGTDRAICLNTSTTLGSIAIVGNTYSWTSMPVGFTSAVADPSVTPLLTTTYAVVETTASGCTNTNSVIVTVNPLPVPEITGPASVCANVTGNIYATTAGMTAYTWLVSSGGLVTAGGTTTDNTVTVTWNTAGAQTVSLNYSGASNCTAASPSIYAITVNPIPAAPVITIADNIFTSDAATGNQWYLEGVLISGATNATYEATQNGIYSATVTLNGCVSALSNTINFINVGISDITAGQFGVYPVPSNGLFTATMAWPKAEMFTIRVYNSIGSLMFEKKDILVDGNAKQLIDLGKVPDGIYTVLFTSGKSQMIRKMIVSSK